MLGIVVAVLVTLLGGRAATPADSAGGGPFQAHPHSCKGTVATAPAGGSVPIADSTGAGAM
jgi:hypothetical protein